MEEYKLKAKYKFYSSVFILILLLWVVGCGGSEALRDTFAWLPDNNGGGNNTPIKTPLETLAEVSSFIKNNDITNAKSLFTSNSQERMQSHLQEADNTVREELSKTISSATIISQTTNRITYKTTITLPDGQVVNPIFEMVLEKGVWKLSDL